MHQTTTQKIIVCAASILALFITNTTFAKDIPHTWHTVSTTYSSWNARLQMINQQGYFVDRNGAALSTFTLDAAHAQDFGFVLDPDNDFDVAYTLTITENTSTLSPNFTSKSCVYIVTASGPAQPDIRASSFNGAKCEWNVVHGVGENFFIA